MSQNFENEIILVHMGLFKLKINLIDSGPIAVYSVQILILSFNNKYMGNKYNL